MLLGYAIRVIISNGSNLLSFECPMGLSYKPLRSFQETVRSSVTSVSGAVTGAFGRSRYLVGDASDTQLVH